VIGGTCLRRQTHPQIAFRDFPDLADTVYWNRGCCCQITTRMSLYVALAQLVCSRSARMRLSLRRPLNCRLYCIRMVRDFRTARPGQRSTGTSLPGRSHSPFERTYPPRERRCFVRSHLVIVRLQAQRPASNSEPISQTQCTISRSGATSLIPWRAIVGT
jgi:hypothetical protein